MRFLLYFWFRKVRSDQERSETDQSKWNTNASNTYLTIGLGTVSNDRSYWAAKGEKS